MEKYLDSNINVEEVKINKENKSSKTVFPKRSASAEKRETKLDKK